MIYNNGFNGGIMNMEELEKSNDIIKLHKNDEDIVLSEINKNYERINCGYHTGNTNGLVAVEFELIRKFKIISKIHYDNTFVIDMNIIIYRKAIKKASKILGNIKIGDLNDTGTTYFGKRKN